MEANEIAQGIARELFDDNCIVPDYLIPQISAALREYGNEEYLRGFKDGSAK